MKNSYPGELRSEFLGTMILILFCVGMVAQVVTTPDGGLGDHDSIAVAWAIGVTLGVYVAVRLAWAHVKPAVSIAPAAFRGFREVPHPAGTGGPGEERARVEAASRTERVGRNPAGTQETRS